MIQRMGWSNRIFGESKCEFMGAEVHKLNYMNINVEIKDALSLNYHNSL